MTKVLATYATWSFIGLTLFACGGQPPQAPPPPKVTVVQAVAREVIEWDEYTARLEAVDSVEVRPRVSGYLQSIDFKEGSMVRKGDPLFLIDPRPYEATLRGREADLELARSRLEIAKKNFARVDLLLPRHAMSKEDADARESAVRQAEAAVLKANADVDSAKLNVEFTRITAPVGGRVGRKLVTQGNLVNGGLGTQGTLLTTIVSLDPMYAYFEADERSYLKYMRLAREGQRPTSRDFMHPVHVGLADEDGFPRQGLMDFVDNQLDAGTGTMVGRAVLPNPDLALTPGLFARLRLPGSGKYAALLLPDEGIGSDQAQKFVFVVDAENKAQYRGVKTGPLVDGLRVVREGLTANDWVVVGGLQRVRPELVVSPERKAIETPPASNDGTPATPPAEIDG